MTGLYLVCRLVRKGKMLVDQKETKKEKVVLSRISNIPYSTIFSLVHL
jgi:hypothetical protein